MNDIITLLKDFHFTESEAKVYISLLENGPGTGYEISKLSGVPNSKVYSILESLTHKNAIVTSQSSKNKMYKAEPVENLSKLLLNRATDATNKLVELGSILGNRVYDDKIWHLSKHDNIMTTAMSLIRSATTEIMLQIWVDDLTEELEDIIEMKQDDGINVLVILYDLQEKYETKLHNIYRHGFEKVKLHDLHSRWFNLTVDGEEMLYASVTNNDDISGIHTKNQSMIYFSQEYIKHDAYCLRMINVLNENHPNKINDYLVGVRDIFSN